MLLIFDIKDNFDKQRIDRQNKKTQVVPKYWANLRKGIQKGCNKPVNVKRYDSL